MDLTKEEELVWDIKVGGKLGCGDYGCWSSGSFEEGAGKIPGSQPETSEDQILADLRICLEDYHRKTHAYLI